MLSIFWSEDGRWGGVAVVVFTYVLNLFNDVPLMYIKDFNKVGSNKGNVYLISPGTANPINLGIRDKLNAFFFL